MPGLPTTLAVLTTASTFAAGAQAQVTPLLKADRSISHPFERVRGLHELRDGRLVVLDANAQSVLLVDVTADLVRPIGRLGSGPGEYRFPTGLMNLGGDSIGIFDNGNRRIVVVTRDGKPGAILGPHGTRIADQSKPGSQDPLASDNRGNLYTLAFSNFGSDATRHIDSAPIERWRLGNTVRDTIAYLPLLAPDERILPPGQGSRAFVIAPQWAVGQDGQIAVVRPKPYSVEYIDSRGIRTKGKPIPYRRIRVTAAHQKQWRHDYERPRPVMMSQPGDRAPRPGVRVRRPFEPVQWPDHLPPFLSIRFDPQGTLWVHRTTEVGSPEVFDLIDRQGNLVRQIRTPPRTQLVGFGRSHVYLVRLDPDHQEFLERYPMPSPVQPGRAPGTRSR